MASCISAYGVALVAIIVLLVMFLLPRCRTVIMQVMARPARPSPGAGCTSCSQREDFTPSEEPASRGPTDNWSERIAEDLDDDILTGHQEYVESVTAQNSIGRPTTVSTTDSSNFIRFRPETPDQDPYARSQMLN